MRVLFLTLAILGLTKVLFANCDPYLSKQYSPRNSYYEIKVKLNTVDKTLAATQVLTFINTSPDTIESLHFYMYQNAFKNTESTFMQSAEGNLFGTPLSQRGEEEWGWIEVNSAKRNGKELIGNARYIQPDDNNVSDQTVLEIGLDQALLPGDTLRLNMVWSEKIPKIFARSGYERKNFYNMVHWFPQLGVWEQDRQGNWGWNCHQFHRRTEFYADFGVYDVSITLPKELVTGASGCEVNYEEHGDGTKTVTYHAEDVIDFAWCAYPHFEVVEDQWEHVFIRLLIPPEHLHLADRIMLTAKHGLQYMNDHVGFYPYTSLTILDPPLLGLKAGFMEYPTYITGGSFAFIPPGTHTVESLIAHEFAHQYFMGMVANNEKEEPWLDEGFVTFYEDKIMESLYGTDGSMFHILGYRVNNSAFSRHEYVSLPNPSCGRIARSGWEINEGFKGITYSKTATVLKTMEGMMGPELFEEMMKSYFAKYSFKHPRGEDLVKHVRDFLANSERPNAIGNVDSFFQQLVYDTDILDYSAADISYYNKITGKGVYDTGRAKTYQSGEQDEQYTSTALLHRKGGVILPVEVKFTFADGSTVTRIWSGRERSKTFYFQNPSKLITIEIDPEAKLYIDINLNNNSLTNQFKRTPALKISSKVMYWVSNIIQTIGILI